MTINAVKLYKLNNIQWVFDDPGKKIYAEAFVAGADTLVDIILGEQKLDPEGDLVLLFSDMSFPAPRGEMYKIALEDDKNESLGPNGGTFYNYFDHTWNNPTDFPLHPAPLNHPLWLCPTLSDYYDKPPIAIYIHIKGQKLPGEKIKGTKHDDISFVRI